MYTYYSGQARGENHLRGMGFNEFVDILIENPTSIYKLVEHSIPQIEYISINGKIFIDYIGRVETIDSDWKKICKKISIPHKKLQHKNKSVDRKHYSEYYNETTKNKIYEFYKDDIEVLKYRW